MIKFNELDSKNWDAELEPLRSEMNRVLLVRLKEDEKKFKRQASVLVRDGYRFGELIIVQKTFWSAGGPESNVVPTMVIPEKVLNRRLFWRRLTDSYFWKKEKELGLL